ncbi:prefoldin subunit beta [Nanoarchaeota archaeon NZ13-N]|uniref:Prefoldin subunit beta n=1 Tax=Candidatus Nanoclepta minutus TaxID=1940235 RepID=A0A397WMD0_9ARCH|nr:MAG: prefoldin subunit beta [Nanoarchaeota archaeon NZ13-N]RIB35210.1 MAG: prefoldin subunit beta [Candidatus Nanoclepta minutus]
MDEEIINKKLEEFEVLRQTYLAALYQKQRLEEELLEVENAIKELEGLTGEEKVFVMIGNVMIRKDKNNVLEELKEKRDVLNIRIKSIDKQESQLRERLTNLQNEIEKLIGTSKKDIK